MYVVKSKDANLLTTKLVGADINVAKIGAPRTNAYTDVPNYSDSKLVFDNVTLSVKDKEGVSVSGEIVVDPKSNLAAGTNGITVAKDTRLILQKGVDGVRYTDGAKVVIGGNEYTVYHYKSGDIEIQYGISCGDVYYTGKELTKLDVRIIAISLTQGFTAGNVSYELEYDGTIKDAVTYTDALGIQITFTGDVAVTSNLRTDLIVKPAPIDIKFTVPETYNGVDVSEFQKVQIDSANGMIAGMVGYYNLADDMDGYYLVIGAQVVGMDGKPLDDATITAIGIEFSNGVYMLHLGQTYEEAMNALKTGIVFSAELDNNHSKPRYTFNVTGVEVVKPITISAMGSNDNVLGTSATTLHKDVGVSSDANDVTKFDVKGTLLWKAKFTGFNTANYKEQRGWYLALNLSREAVNDNIDWTGWKEVLGFVGGTSSGEMEVQGWEVFRISDVSKNPYIVLKDPNGFKTKYVLNIDGIDFGTATGYGETKEEAEAILEENGVKPEELTDGQFMSRTMFMIYNARNAESVLQTAVCENNKARYECTFEGISKNTIIWYFSLDNPDQFVGGEPGPYTMTVKNGDQTIATGDVTVKGVFVIESGFESDADKARAVFEKHDPNWSGDVLDNTFYMIVKVYGYDSRTEFVTQMINSQGVNILSEDVGSWYLEQNDGDNEDGVLCIIQYPFGSTTLANTPQQIYGPYTMNLVSDGKVLAFDDILVATSSFMHFGIAEKVEGEEYTTFGTGFDVANRDDNTVKLYGTLNFIRSEARTGYFFPLSMNTEEGAEYPNATLTIDGTTASFGDRLLPITAEKKTYKVVVDLDGDGTTYSATTYTLTFTGELEEISYGILLSDPFYGDKPLEFTSGKAGVTKFTLPNGPDGSKQFIGWKIEGENGAIYSNGAFVILSAGMDADGNGDVVFTAVYKGSQQRVSYSMEASVSDTDKGSVLTIKTNSDQVKDYRNLSANHYYLIAMFNADGKSIWNKVLASPRILNGGDVYSESVDIELPEKFGLGYSILIDFKTDYAMGMIEICKSVILQNTVASDSGFVADAAEACEAINEALAKHEREQGVDVNDVDSNTAYTVFDTTDEMNGKTLTAYLYKGNDLLYAERMTFGTPGAHVWYFSFNDAAPSHTEGGNVLTPMAEGTEPDGEYTVFILDDDGHNVVKSKFTA